MGVFGCGMSGAMKKHFFQCQITWKIAHASER